MKKSPTLAAAAVLFALASSGCATRMKMAFENDADRLTEKSPPVYLMTTTIRNAHKPGWQPSLRVVHVEKEGAEDADGRFNFLMDDKGRSETDAPETGNSYFVRMELPPGKYRIVGMSSFCGGFPIAGSFFTPLHSPLEVKDPGVFYLGHVNAIVRERQGTEFRAGPAIPLIDQGVVGASGGTFDVTIVDGLATDEPQFRARFPGLNGTAIQKAILPPFDRARAQAWWEAR